MAGYSLQAGCLRRASSAFSFSRAVLVFPAAFNSLLMPQRRGWR
jgi:hypothetical protein